MEKLMKWMNEKFAPTLYKITGSRWISSIMGGFQKYMPVLITGALFQIVGNLMPLIAPNLALPFNVMYDLTFGLLALFLAYTIAHSIAQHHNINPLTTGLFAMSVFLILQKPAYTENGSIQIELARLGSSGLFVAIISALFVGEVIGLFQNKKWTLSSDDLPDFVKDWFAPIVPGLIIIALAWVVSYVLGIDIHNMIAKIITPLMSTADTLPGFVGTAFFLTILFTVGINGAVTFGVMFPLWFAAVGENAGLVAQGLPPVHINMLHTISAFVVLGGTGATLMLNIFMLGSKSKSIKALGRTSIIPSLMNINEPLIFGLPIAFNPILAIPFVLNGGIINPLLTYLALNSGLVTKPFNPAIIPWIPSFIQGYFYTQDFKAVLFILVELVINGFVWYPFFKAFENKKIEEEN
jgi:cellobiose PTS system EIIC component